MGFAAAVLHLALLMTAAATADSGARLLTYDAPAGCPREEQWRADVEGHVHDRARLRDFRIELVLVAGGGQFSGQLVTTDRAGVQARRSIAGPNCGDVAHALAFLAGLAVDLAGPAARQETPAAPAPAPTPPPRPPSPTILRSLAFTTLASAGLRGGLADGPRPVGEIGFGVSDARARVLAPAVRLTLIAGQGEIDGPGGSAELRLITERLTVCPLRISAGQVEARPCAGVEAGGVWARASSLANQSTNVERWVSVEATVAVRWLAGKSLFVELEGGAVLPIIRDSYTFAFQPGTPLYRTPALTARGAAGIGFRL
jgi:hypothetical protein